MQTAMLLGATGLVGGELLQLILANDQIEQLYVLVRKPIEVNHPKLRVLETDFSDLAKILEGLHVKMLFSCLGTTRNKTPDLNLYRRIEIGIPLEIIELLAANGLQQLHYISSIGANADSRTFYPKLKGEAEKTFTQTVIPTKYFYRPSMILGDRKEKRIVELIVSKIMLAVNPLLSGSWKKYRSIAAHTIAKAMLQNALHPVNGAHTLESDAIAELGK